MSSSRSVDFAGILNWICSHPRWWFSFIENVMLTGLLQYLAWHLHSWVLLSLWLGSIVFLIAPIARATIEGFRAGLDRLPWARLETLPRTITYPAMFVVGLTAPVALLVVGDYTTFQIANVVEAVAKSHVALH